MKRIILPSLLALYSHSIKAQVFNLDGFEFGGYIDGVASWTNANFVPFGQEPAYLGTIRKQPNYDHDSRMAFTIVKTLTPKVKLRGQFATDGRKKWQVEVPWAYVLYDPNEYWRLRAGKLRTEPLQYSVTINEGFTFPWIRPPQEVYFPVSYVNHSGMDSRFKVAILDCDLVLGLFVGGASSHQLSISIPGDDGALKDQPELRIRQVTNFNVRYGNEILSVRGAFETGHVTISPNEGTFIQSLNAFLNNEVALGVIGNDYYDYFTAYNARASIISIGYQFDWQNFVSIAEFAQRHTAINNVANTNGWYVMGGYRIQQLLPHVTFGRLRTQGNKVRRFPSEVNAASIVEFGDTLDNIAQGLVEVSSYKEGAGDQTSLTFGVRWDVIKNLALKGEISHVHPDRGRPGLFTIHPHKSVNVYSFGFSAEM